VNQLLSYHKISMHAELNVQLYKLTLVLAKLNVLILKLL